MEENNTTNLTQGGGKASAHTGGKQSAKQASLTKG